MSSWLKVDWLTAQLHSDVAHRCRGLIHPVYVLVLCVLMSGSDLKTPSPVGVQWHCFNCNILLLNALNRTSLCSPVDLWASVNQSWCLWHHWGPDVYISIPEPRGRRAQAAALSAGLWSCPCNPLTLRHREAHCGRAEWTLLGNIKHTQSDQTTTTRSLPWLCPWQEKRLSLGLHDGDGMSSEGAWQGSDLWSTTDSSFKCFSLLDSGSDG